MASSASSPAGQAFAISDSDRALARKRARSGARAAAARPACSRAEIPGKVRTRKPEKNRAAAKKHGPLQSEESRRSRREKGRRRTTLPARSVTPAGIAAAVDDFSSLAGLPAGSVVGTSSLRRQAQLKALRPDLGVHSLRGNVDTRLRKLEAGEYDVVILAAAGLNRLGRTEWIRAVLPVEMMCPAVGQGALGIEIRSGDKQTGAHLEFLNDAAAFAAGLVSIAFPCVLPLVPGYLSAITAVEVDRLGERGVARRVVAASVPFALGFTVVFVVLGAGAAALGGWVDQETRTKIAGFVLVVLGLAFMGLLPWPERMLAPGAMTRARASGSRALLGAAFAVCANGSAGCVKARAASRSSWSRPIRTLCWPRILP